jgi:RNA polymerase-binding transcription factor DksA
MNETAERLSRIQADALVTMADLEANLAEIANSSEDNADDEHDPEGSTLAYERARIGSLLEKIRNVVVDLEQSLDRVRLGTYGVCESCGIAIPHERLEAIPTATVCVACANSKAS